MLIQLGNIDFLLRAVFDGFCADCSPRSLAGFDPTARSRIPFRHRALFRAPWPGAPMLEDFKKFAMRGNVIDLAVGVIIGAAFGKIIDSVVNDLIMPVIGAIFGGLDFTNYFVRLSSKVPENIASYADAKKLGAVFGYGAFLTAFLNFVIIAFALFLLIRAINKMSTKPEAAPAEPPPPSREEVLLGEIRDLLAKR
jgi:large conductance mechanosensitive channel